MFDPSTVTVPSEAALRKLLDKTKGMFFFGQRKNTGFLGSLLCSHEFVFSTLNRTAWCDGKKIGFNPAFFIWLTPEERVTVRGHELWHTGLTHMIRMDNRNPDIWNQSADHVINLMLQTDGFIFGEKLMSIGPCIDDRFRDMTTEQVYEILLQESMQSPAMPVAATVGLPGAPSGQQPGTPTPDPSRPMHGDLVPVFDKVEQTKVIAKVVAAEQQAQMGKEAGSLPREVKLVLDKFLNPVLPWNQILHQWLSVVSKDDYSFRRPNRRHDEYLPSLSGNNGLEGLVYFFDLSGSTTDKQVTQFNTETWKIHQDLQPEKMTLITFDTVLHDVIEFAWDEEYQTLEVHGRGGTSLEEVYEYIVEHKPPAVVIFTDLHVRPMPADPLVPIFWICVNNPDATVPFGTLVHMNVEED